MCTGCEKRFPIINGTHIVPGSANIKCTNKGKIPEEVDIKFISSLYVVEITYRSDPGDPINYSCLKSPVVGKKYLHVFQSDNKELLIPHNRIHKVETWEISPL